jgi:hypothetical protein
VALSRMTRHQLEGCAAFCSNRSKPEEGLDGAQLGSEYPKVSVSKTTEWLAYAPAAVPNRKEGLHCGVVLRGTTGLA